MKQEMTGFWDGSVICVQCYPVLCWTICKQSAPRSRHINTQTPHNLIFTRRMLFLTPNQVFQNNEGKK